MRVHLDLRLTGSEIASCASADFAEIVDIRAAATSVLSPVIVILHLPFRARIRARDSCSRGDPSGFFSSDYVGIAVEKTALHAITVLRTRKRRPGAAPHMIHAC